MSALSEDNMRTIIALILGASCMVVLHALCPDPASLKDLNGNKICARLFKDSHCGGEALDILIGDDVPAVPSRWKSRASSLVVSSHCYLTVWSRINKQGSKRKFRSGIQYRLKDVPKGGRSLKGLFGNWDNEIAAYYCTCC
ncbi:syncollin-like [Osmerus eperlanus]|uniref:syncollin-like n=1 Tax=Osmerus eperlanus TaxID=29151 RepID=UPI002E14FFDD